MQDYIGGCLCGNIRYRLSGKATFPHFCSCRMCQRASGAPVMAWVDFPRSALRFEGPGGDPAFYRSSEATRRGFCPRCGSAICAMDDGVETVSMTLATFDDADAFVPQSHSFPGSAPSWLKVAAVGPAKRRHRARGSRRVMEDRGR